MITYVTFGQQHTHRVNGITFDCDCVALVRGDRDRVQELFGLRFSTTYAGPDMPPGIIQYFPRGIVYVEPEERYPFQVPAPLDSHDPHLPTK